MAVFIDDQGRPIGRGNARINADVEAVRVHELRQRLARPTTHAQSQKAASAAYSEPEEAFEAFLDGLAKRGNGDAAAMLITKSRSPRFDPAFSTWLDEVSRSSDPVLAEAARRLRRRNG